MFVEKYIKNYINGVFVFVLFGDYLENFMFFIGEVYSYFLDFGLVDVDQAVKVVQEVFFGWFNVEFCICFWLMMCIVDIIE